MIPSERGLEVFYISDWSEAEMKGEKTENGVKVAGANASIAQAQKTKNQDLILSSVGSDIMKIGWGGRTRTSE